MSMQYPDLYQYYNTIHPIPAAEWEEFEPNFSRHHFKPHDTLVKAGDTADTMYVLLDGIVKTYYEDQSGKEYIKIFLSTFEIASPYLEIVNREPSRCHITALVPTTALRFRYLDLELFFQRSVAWKSLHLKVIEHYYSIKEKREFEFLTLSALERYQNFQRDYEHIADQIPQKEVAAFLGISPVSLSRLRRRHAMIPDLSS